MILKMTILVTGAVVLGLELVSSRMMVPVFGTSLSVWGAVLSATLTCLAIGYSLGGALAKKPNNNAILFGSILVAALWISVLPHLAPMFLLWSSKAGNMLGPLLAVLMLLTWPLVLLSASVPLCIGIFEKRPNFVASSSSGNLFAISTLGSVAGALITAYWCIPNFGISRTLYILASALVVVSIPALLKGVAFRLSLFGSGILVLSFLAQDVFYTPKVSMGTEVLLDKQTHYGRLMVMDDHRDASRIMLIDGASQAWVDGPTYNNPRFEYCKAVIETVERYHIPAKRALVIGLGGGTLVQMLARKGFEVDVVDIDQEVVDAAYTFFNLQKDDATVYVEDGRTFLQRSLDEKKDNWDLIVIDASGSSAPEHLYNQEANAIAQSLLTQNGILISHLVAFANPPKNKILQHANATAHSVFKHVEVLVAGENHDNDLVGVLLVGSKHGPRQAIKPTSSRATLELPDDLRPFSDSWNPMGRWMGQSNRRWRDSAITWLGDAVVFSN